MTPNEIIFSLAAFAIGYVVGRSIGVIRNPS